jgi:putative ABC transport system permease protein
MISWPWRRRSSELDEELASHLRLAVEDRVAHGKPRAEAESAARREFGNVLLVREATRREWSWFWLERLLAELALALRTFQRSPRFFLVAWLCIAVGIGATVTIFAVLQAVLLRPLPYADEERLVVVESMREGRSTRFAQLTQEELDALRGARTLEQVGTWRTWESDVTSSDDLPERVLEAQIDEHLLPMLGVKPLLGRWPESEDGTDVVVLSYDLWQRRFRGDRQVIGRSIRIGESEHEVIGVMPDEFSVPEGTQLWRPLGEARYSGHILFYGGAIARLSTGADLVQARAEITATMKALRGQYPADYGQTTYHVNGLRDALLSPLRRPVLLLQGAAVLVLLIACANVAALQLARSAARRRELALRSAIGAGRAGLASPVLAECFALALAGGTGGVLLSRAGVRLVARAFPDGVPSYITLAVDARVLAVAFVATVAAALFFGMAPAVQAARTRAPHALAGFMRSAEGLTPQRRWSSRLLVATEIAISVVLAVSAVQLIRADREMRRGLGFNPEGVLSVRVPLGYRAYREPERRAAFYRQLEEHLRVLPGVEAVTSSPDEVPLDGPMAGFVPFRLASQSAEQAAQQRVSVQWVAAEYARTLGARLLEGRDLTEGDVGGLEHASLVNRAFQTTYLSGRRATDHTVLFDSRDNDRPTRIRIVGVIEDIMHERKVAQVPPAMYIPDPEGTAAQTFVLRTKLGNPILLAPSIRRLVYELDPNLTTGRMQTQTRVVQRAFWRERLQRDVLSIFAGVALLLAACAVYGVLSYAVAQRTSEFGIRKAVGASSQQLLQMVLREATSIAIVGVLIGTLVTLGLTRLLASAAYGVPMIDPLTLAAVSGALLLVSVTAAAAPAIRAMRLDPRAVLND